MHRILFLTLIALMSFSLPAFSGPGDGADDGVVDPFGAPPKVVSFRTLWNVDGARPGDEVILGIVATMDGGFHINADAAQQPPIEDFDPIPTRITVIEASENLNLEVRFPRPHGVTAEYLDGELMAFEGETVFYLPVRLDEDFVGDRVRVTVEIHFQACDNTQCLMPDSEVVSAALPVLAGGATPTPANASFFADVPSAGGGSDRVTFDLFRWTFSVDAASNSGLLLLWVVALFGGFLLNFTPCVLPVIPIKIMSLSNTAGSRGRTLALGVAMFLGIIGFWLALGLVISSVSGFTATNQLFQYPAFSITVGTIIAIMAVGMTGVFYMQLPQAVYQLNPSQESLHGSFGLGIMTAILSTPCTAPFMGAAAVWAAGQSPVITLTTFAAIGLGMGLPYFLLSAFPRLVSRMPRTGPGSELLKQVLGIFMLAAAAYFVGVGLTALLITPPDPPSKFHWWVVMGILAAGGLWLAWRTFGITTRPGKRILFGGLGLMVATLAVMGGINLTAKGPIDWVYYTPERFAQAVSRQVVVMDFTAEWCLNCKSLEHGVLHNDEVTALLDRPQVVPMKVDITGKNPEGKAKLKEAGSLTIPLLLIYAPGGDVILKADFYTVDEVVEAIHTALERVESPTASVR